MNDINTKTIINFLPFDPSLKLKILESYDTLPLPEQIRISDLVWQTYDSIYEMRIKEKFESGLINNPKLGTEPDNTYYMKVLEEVGKEINEELTTHQESADITEVRKSMEQIVKEINASKATKPAPAQTTTPKTS